MTNEEALEWLTKKSINDNPKKRDEALKMAVEALRERDELRERLKIMQHRCVCLTEGHLCKYCVYVDCEYKEQEENAK